MRQAASVNEFFRNERPRSSSRLNVQDLPYMSRPIIEAIHDIRPDIIMAGDRGGRLFARSVLKGWKKRFPGEAFPTPDNKIHIARVTGRSAEGKIVQKAVKYTLEKAGFTPNDTDGSSPSIVYLDDWAVYGSTLEVVKGSLKNLGISKNKLTYATLCGKKIRGAYHVVGDPSVDFGRSAWDWEGGSESLVGVEYLSDDQVTPTGFRNTDAIRARSDLDACLEDYYTMFSLALEAGEIMACECYSASENTVSATTV